MRNTDIILERARREADNEDPTSTSGIEINVPVEWINDAQDTLQSLIAAAYANFNMTEKTFNTVVSTEGYSDFPRLYLSNRFKSVEFSLTGNAADYRPMRKEVIQNRNTDTGQPEFYIRRGNSLLLNPIADSTTYSVRVNYEKELDDLDIRRGRIASVVGAGTSGSPLTSIVLETTLPSIDGEFSNMTVGEYICVCDKDGVVQARNIPFTSFSTATITIPSFELDTDETLPAAGHYVTIGPDTTTNSDLPNACERYLRLHVVHAYLSKDGKTEASERYNRKLSNTEREIINAFASMGEELIEIPTLVGSDEYGML